MFKTIAAAVVALVLMDISVGASRATGLVDAAGPQRSLKSDRLMPRPNEPACAQAGWPPYESHCVRNHSQPGAQPREVRTVAIDRLPPSRRAAPSVT
jgi:hypothetical protein